MPDNHTKRQRSYNMSRIRSSNTQLEKSFFALLKQNKIKFKKQPKIFGKPDCLVDENILVFVDSDFWHGWHYRKWKNRLPKKYWQNKIENNIKRDNKKFVDLKKRGYKVLRIWEHQLKHPEVVLRKFDL